MKAMNNETKNINVNEINEQELEQVNGGLNFFKSVDNSVDQVFPDPVHNRTSVSCPCPVPSPR